MDNKELDKAIYFFKEKIKKQGRITNAYDEEHLQRLLHIKQLEEQSKKNTNN